MKKIILMAVAIFAIGLTSCEDKKKTEAETIIEDARDNNADIEMKDGGDKVKIKEVDGDEVKIKTDDNGDVKIKTDDNN
ncbi:hypothetical protein ULMS_23900 [Patiriisocius marinistellae]|uniref:Uncharacterized protein n=1 Tax=Patiriisocius marinistellae TaxID=2494560 RepID=A0A5J4G037_9FLAO|nr:hypothetical protein [Patiriisocius marinistellae]GEQ86882.1 hypothetical protein ULMS_23900 [Patiriisocius marinistellae]